MGAILVPIVLVIVVAVGAVMLLNRRVAAQSEQHDQLADAGTPSLRYVVPEGEDPAAVLAALHTAGYVATADHTGGPGNQGVLIGDPEGEAPDRDEVRQVIAGAKPNLEAEAGDVAGSRPRFEDE